VEAQHRVLVDLVAVVLAPEYMVLTQWMALAAVAVAPATTPR
jgi:hypothetical protein